MMHFVCLAASPAILVSVCRDNINGCHQSLDAATLLYFPDLGQDLALLRAASERRFHYHINTSLCQDSIFTIDSQSKDVLSE